MRNVEERGTEYGRAEEPEEDRRRDEIVGHVLAAHLREPFPEYAETLAQLDREVRVAGEDARPGELDRRLEVLLLLVEGSDRGDLEGIDLAVATLDGTTDHGAQGLLEVAVARQLQVRLHSLGCQAVASERQPLVICEVIGKVNVAEI